MAELKFVVQSHIERGIDPSKSKPVNNALLSANKEAVTKQLSHHIDKINACGGYVLVSVRHDGETFENQLLGFNDPVFYAKVVDELNSI